MNEKYIEDFNTALNIYQKDYSHDDLIKFLKNGSIVEKQTSAIKLDKIFSKDEAKIFISNLVGCDGKIREAISFRLPEYVKENPEFFVNYTDIFLEAIIDINGNICRNTITALKYLENFETFSKPFCEKLLEKTYELAKIAKTFDIQDGKYKINKQVFKLYWYLETISLLINNCNQGKVLEIVRYTKDIFDYTIREKTAKILTKLENSSEISQIKDKLKNDQNYYVRRL